MIDHHHGAIVQITDALVELLAFLENRHRHPLAGQHHGHQRIGQIVDIQHFDMM